MRHSSKAARSQSCHFAFFVNPVARSSTDEFFTLCDAHLEHERMAQAASLQRRHGLTQKQVSALWQVLSLSVPHCSRATAHIAGGASFLLFGTHAAGELRLTLQELSRGSPLVYERAPHIH